MTNIPETIEEQFKELERQYTHAQNIITALKVHWEDEKRQRLSLEMRLAAKSELIRTLEARIEHLSGDRRLCSCDVPNCC